MYRTAFSLCAALLGVALSACGDSDKVAGPEAIRTAARTNCIRTVTLVSFTSPVPHNTGGYQATFNVKNLSNIANTAPVTCTGSGPITCFPASSSQTIASGATLVYHVEYDAGAAGTKSWPLQVKSCGGAATALIKVN